jgi:hypothetical protein
MALPFAILARANLGPMKSREETGEMHEGKMHAHAYGGKRSLAGQAGRDARREESRGRIDAFTEHIHVYTIFYT